MILARSLGGIESSSFSADRFRLTVYTALFQVAFKASRRLVPALLDDCDVDKVVRDGIVREHAFHDCSAFLLGERLECGQQNGGGRRRAG